MIAPMHDDKSLPMILACARRRYMAVALTAAVIIATLITANSARHSPILVWNASASAPIGLYLRQGEITVSRGDLVLVEPPRELARLADERHYLPLGVPLIKRVVALAGSTICGAGDSVMIDGAMALKRQRRDRQGRPLPSWSRCHRPRYGEVFLAMENAPGSFDGRYFGALPVSAIRGRLVPLWTR
jgi:conjugative transfer signal peptidase TraF